MRYSTSKRYQFGLDGQIPVTTLFLDCAHQLTYYGDPETAEHTLRDSGGTIAGNITRCKDCAARYQALVQDNIRHAREAHQ